jgi:hypothetical protein
MPENLTLLTKPSLTPTGIETVVQQLTAVDAVLELYYTMSETGQTVVQKFWGLLPHPGVRIDGK